MTDETMTTAESPTAEGLVDLLEADADEDLQRLLFAVGERGGESRELVEILGLLAYEVEAVSPSPELRVRLMERIAAIDAPPLAASGVADFRARQASRRWSPRSTNWLTLLAATLAFCVVGLGSLSFNLRGQVAEQRAAIDRLTSLVNARSAQDVELAAIRQQLDLMENRFGIVTGAASEVCALLPPDLETAALPSARAVLYVAADHQHWYLKARGLEPLEGRVYQLWFVPEGGDPVSAGTFQVAVDQIELSSETMPDKTSAVLVTLETSPAERPSDAVVLYGDEAMQLL